MSVSEEIKTTVKPKAESPKSARRVAAKRRTNSAEFSNPFLVQQIRLNSTPAQSLLVSNYEGCDYALRGISVVLPVILNDESEIMKVNGAVDHVINVAMANIREEAARITKVAEDNGMELSSVSYTNTSLIAVNITSAKSGRYLQLIREFDSLIGLLHAAWLSGFMGDEQKAKNEREWRKVVASAGSEIEKISARAFAAAKRTIPTPPASTDAKSTEKSLAKSKEKKAYVIKVDMPTEGDDLDEIEIPNTLIVAVSETVTA